MSISRAHAVASFSRTKPGWLVSFLRFSWVVISDVLCSPFFLFYFFFQYGCDPSQIYLAKSGLFDREHNEMRKRGKTVLVLGKGKYKLLRRSNKYFELDYPTKIYGQGRAKTTLVGFGLLIKGKKSEGIVEIEDLTIKGAKATGLFAYNGMKVIMRGCTVVCEGCGVHASGADISCDDLQVIGCGSSGVCASSKATITLSGQGTSIQRNGLKMSGIEDLAPNVCCYGLDASSSSFIHLVPPLTKEQISTDNRWGSNWGGDGTIEQVSIEEGARLFREAAEKEEARTAAREEAEK